MSDILDQLQGLEYIEFNTPEGLTDGDRNFQQQLEQQQRDLKRQQEIFDKRKPENDNRPPVEPWKRAELILEAHAEIARTPAHVSAVPQAAITALLKDVMHYCQARSEGEALDSPNRLDFDKLSRVAAQQFVAEQRTSGETAQELERHRPEMRLSEQKAAAEDPELATLLNDLGARHAREALELSNKQELHIHGSPTSSQEESHRREYDDLTKQFAKERQSFIGDYNVEKEKRLWENSPENWSDDATIKKEDYFNRYLDGKQSPDDTAFEPELAHLMTKLYERQRSEAYELLDRTIGEMRHYEFNETGLLHDGGCAPETLKLYKDPFQKEYCQQCEGFARERERYIGEFQKAREILDQMEQRESLEKGLDDEPKLTR